MTESWKARNPGFTRTRTDDGTWYVAAVEPFEVDGIVYIRPYLSEERRGVSVPRSMVESLPDGSHWRGDDDL